MTDHPAAVSPDAQRDICATCGGWIYRTGCKCGAWGPVSAAAPRPAGPTPEATDIDALLDAFQQAWGDCIETPYPEKYEVLPKFDAARLALRTALASARAALAEEQRSALAHCDQIRSLNAALSEATRREEEAFVAGFVDGATGGKLSASSESVRAEARHNARNYVAIRAALVAAETEITILKDQRDERADERNEASGQIEALQAALSEATRDTRLLDLLAVSGPGIWERLGRRYDWERSTPALLRAAIGAEIPNGAERLASRAALPEETSNGH